MVEDGPKHFKMPKGYPKEPGIINRPNWVQIGSNC